jgi:hypothetical protein
MYSIRADVLKNRLYVKFNGFFEFKEMKECTDKTIIESKKLKPGFDVITDISQFKAVGQETLAEVKRAQAYLKQSGVRHAIRIAGNSAVANSQFSRVGKTTAYAPETVATLADAEKYLNSLN